MTSDVLLRRKEAFIAWMDATGLNVHKVAKASGIRPTTLYSYVEGSHAPKSLRGEAEAKIAAAYGLPADAIFGPYELAEEPNYVRAWREAAGLTVEQLATAIGTTPAILQMLEAGEITLSAKWLRRLAPALGASAGYILDHHPDEVPQDVRDVFARVPDADKRHALEILETFAKRASG